MKKILLILVVALLFGAGPVQAQAPPSLTSVAGSATSREYVRNAGVKNFGCELYYTPDGSEPSAELRQRDGAAYGMKEGAQPAVVNRMPGDLTGKWWLVVKPKAINAGEIKSEETLAEGESMPYREHLGGYLLDLSRLPAGEYFISYTVRHMGGENVMQVLVFIFRSKREVTDEAGFWLTVYSPDRPYYQIEANAGAYLRSFERLDGAEPYQLAHRNERAAPTNIRPGTGSGFTTDQPSGMGTVTVHVFDDQQQLKAAEGEFWLKSKDGSFQTPRQKTANGLAVFEVPPGIYVLQAANKSRWQMSPGSTAEIVVPEAGRARCIVERSAQ